MKLRLKVNEAKSAVARPEERKFLGFTISNDGGERRIAPKALDKFKERIREITCQTRGLSLSQIIEQLTPYLIGWHGYSASARRPGYSRNWKRGSAEDCAHIFGGSGERAQPLQRTAPSWRIEVQGGGRRRFTDGILANVRTPGGPSGPAQPPLQFDRVFPNSMFRTRLNPIEPPWYATRMPGGVGGAAP